MDHKFQGVPQTPHKRSVHTPSNPSNGKSMYANTQLEKIHESGVGLLTPLELDADTSSSKPVGDRLALWKRDLADETKPGTLKVIGNTFVSFIGAGILGLPYAFSKVGVTVGCVVTAGIGIICLQAMLLLLRCKYMVFERTGVLVSSYGDLAHAIFGDMVVRVHVKNVNTNV